MSQGSPRTPKKRIWPVGWTWRNLTREWKYKARMWKEAGFG